MDRLERASSRTAGKFVLGMWIVLLVSRCRSFAHADQAPDGRRLRGPWLAARCVRADSLKRSPGVQTETLVLVFDNSKKRQVGAQRRDRQGGSADQGRRRRRGAPAGRAGRARGRGRPADRAGARSTSPAGRTPPSTPPSISQERRYPGRRRQPRGADPPRRPAGAVGRHAGRLQEGPREGRVRGLPGRLHRAAAVFGTLAAALLPLSLGFSRPSCSPARSSSSCRRQSRCRSS